jgi:homoserine kinase
VIHETGGWCLDVTEAEIAVAKAELGREGIGCEPASAVTLAGLKKLVADGRVAPSDTVVLLLTGHTLKDSDYTIDFHRGTLLEAEEAAPLAAGDCRAAAECRRGGGDSAGGAGGAQGNSEQVGLAVGPIRLRLPATSANLGAAFDCAAVALALYLTVEAEEAEAFSIAATGEDAELCSRIEDNLILETYKSLLAREGKPAVPWRFGWTTGFRWGWAVALRLRGGWRRLRWRRILASWAGSSDRILAEACALEGHPDNAAACWLGGMVVAAMEGERVHVARVEPPADGARWWCCPVRRWRPARLGRFCRRQTYSRADAVANIQAASLLGLAFAQGRGELLRPAMQDRLHQPYRARDLCAAAAAAAAGGECRILGVALSGAGPSVLLISGGSRAHEAAKRRSHGGNRAGRGALLACRLRAFRSVASLVELGIASIDCDHPGSLK